MKIIYIANSRIPTEKAHGYQICKMCEEFSNLGNQVELWAPRRKNDITKDAYSFYGIKDNFEIKKIKSFDFFQYYKHLRKLSFWLQNIWFVIKLGLIKPDEDAIIYTRDPEIAWLFNLRKYDAVYEAHTWPENREWLYKFLIKKTEKIITITHSLADFFVKAGCLKNNILVAPDGVDLNKFDIDLSKTRAREKFNLPLDKKIILYAGHLYSWKGADILAQAANRLSRNCLVIFVGGLEADINIFREKHKKLIENGEIAIYPHQRHGLIPFWLKAADVLVLPNKSGEKISKYFTSPLKLFEYMASQRPIVASDLPSIREALNENSCLFFRSDSPEDLAEKIELILHDGGLAEKISQRAYQDVKKRTWEKRAEKIIDFIGLA